MAASRAIWMSWCPDRIAVEQIFMSHSKFVWTVYMPGTQRKGTKKRDKNLTVVQLLTFILTTNES